MNDEKDKDRQTLSSLVHKAKELRLVPVGRMERDSTLRRYQRIDMFMLHVRGLLLYIFIS